MTLALCILFAAVGWVAALVAYINGKIAREWVDDCRKSALQAEIANEAAGQNAARASASEYATAAWARAARPHVANCEEFQAALLKEHNRRPIPADAANSDWGMVKLIPAEGEVVNG